MSACAAPPIDRFVVISHRTVAIGALQSASVLFRTGIVGESHCLAGHAGRILPELSIVYELSATQ
jgi:hypothetical protein